MIQPNDEYDVIFCRYIAIIFPIKAHLLCTRKHTLLVIIAIWMASGTCGVPTMMYDQVTHSGNHITDIRFCQMIMPENSAYNFIVYKYVEAILFYFIPLLIQVICYAIIGRVLFVGVEELHSYQPGRQNGDQKRMSDALSRRRGVVKMLVSSVSIYFLSYSPHQILLIYNTFWQTTFHETWIFFVLVTILAYVNSAANPILYCVFSENFRRHFSNILLRHSHSKPEANDMAMRSTVVTHNSEYTVLIRNNKNYGVSDV